jgi:hypothetical protein
MGTTCVAGVFARYVFQIKTLYPLRRKPPAP